MSYSVVWRPQAEQDLAQVWLNAPDRSSVTSAANQIDQQLAHEPLQGGRCLYGTTRARFCTKTTLL